MTPEFRPEVQPEFRGNDAGHERATPPLAPEVRTGNPRGRECMWAPDGHSWEAVYMLRLLRPCGHSPDLSSGMTPSCVECAAKARMIAERGEVRATPCPTCGDVNAPSVVEARSL